MNKKINIALIDDHTIFRESLEKYFGRQDDIEVCHSWSNGEDALIYINGSNIDVIVIDLSLPGMDGITTIKRLRNYNRNINFIILSMFAKEETILEAFEAGASGYLPKEASLEQLCDAIRTVYNGESVLSEKLTKKFVKYCTSLKMKPELGENGILSEEQIEVLKLSTNGYSNKQIANKLGLSLGIVKNRFREIFRILDARDRTHAVIKAIRKGLIEI